jgi:hypothetical protein
VLWESSGKLEVRKTSMQFASWQEATHPLLRISLNHVACQYSYVLTEPSPLWSRSGTSVSCCDFPRPKDHMSNAKVLNFQERQFSLQIFHQNYSQK